MKCKLTLPNVGFKKENEVNVTQKTFVGILIIAGLFPHEPVRAETVKNVSVVSTFDNNAYGSSAEKADQITQVGIYFAGRNWNDVSQIEYFYAGNGNLFAQSGERNFTTNNFGILYGRKLGEEKDRLYAGGNFSFRLDRSYYDVYDYVGAKGFVNGKWYVHPSVLLRLGYRLRLRHYWNLESFSYNEHYLFAQISKFLPSKTTLRGEISFGYKNHPNPEGINNFNFGPARRFRLPADPGVPDEGQAVLAVQVAQSLAANTGISLRYQTRINTTSDRFFLSGEETGYSDDEDIFNDRYDYEGHEWTFRLTQLLPRRLGMEIEGGYEIRNYDGREALDLSGQPIVSGAFRRDRTTVASIFFEKPIFQNLSAGIWYGYDRNRVNDAYYDYSGRQSLSMELKLGF